MRKVSNDKYDFVFQITLTRTPTILRTPMPAVCMLARWYLAMNFSSLVAVCRAYSLVDTWRILADYISATQWKKLASHVKNTDIILVLDLLGLAQCFYRVGLPLWNCFLLHMSYPKQCGFEIPFTKVSCVSFPGEGEAEVRVPVVTRGSSMGRQKIGNSLRTVLQQGRPRLTVLSEQCTCICLCLWLV